MKGETQTTLTDGGFPDAQDIDIRDRRPLLQGYVDVAVLRDIIERHGISYPIALRWLQVISSATPPHTSVFRNSTMR